jgi:RNA polymerase sigma-70 factor, ECF subfamily
VVTPRLALPLDVADYPVCAGNPALECHHKYVVPVFRRSDPTPNAGAQLAELYREHATSTYRFALHFCGNPADAEDLVQTAFLEAHRRLLRGEQLVNPRAWLASVVRTRALNLRRDRHDIAASDRLEQLAGVVEPTADASEQLARVRAVLWSLPEAQHQAFVLRHWCDLPNREIAGVLGTTESAVESLLVRAGKAVAGAEELAPACVAVRDRLAQGLPETPAGQAHRESCRSCRSASERLAAAAAIAGVLALAPRLTVAHALAATVPGFTTAAATSTAAGTASAGVTATATKAIVAKTLITTLAVGTTAAALHSGIIHIPLPHQHTTRAATAPRSVDPISTPGDPPAVILHPDPTPTTRPTTTPLDADPHHNHAASPDQSDQAMDTNGSSPTDGGSGTSQDSQGGSTDAQQQSGSDGGDATNGGDGSGSSGQSSQDQQSSSGDSSGGTTSSDGTSNGSSASQD